MPDLSIFTVGGWQHPIPSHRTISSHFGASRSGNRPAECGAGHCGLDFPAPVGVPVYAIHDGVVLIAQQNEIAGGAAGRYVKLEHAGGQARSWYIHLDTVGVKAKQQVRAGQQVGTNGLTGVKNTPPHLHFALAVKSGSGYVYIDPEPFVANWGSSVATAPSGGGSGSTVAGGLALVAVAGLALLLWRSLR